MAPRYVVGPGAESDPSRPSLSVCIVGQDMAPRIGPLLDQADAIADEIVYVDGGSRDGSADLVARHPKARFIVRPFDGNIARQKNFALDQARCDWVLILDTDELLGPRLLRLLPRLLLSPARSVRCPRYWLVDDRHYVHASGVYPDRQLRLFRNVPELRYDEAHLIHHPFRHEQLLEPCVRLKGAHLLHYDLMWNDRESREAKVRRYEKAHPSLTGVNRYYLYEDMPHRIASCREYWEGGSPGTRPDVVRAAIDRFRLWRLGSTARLGRRAAPEPGGAP
ncbi:MAG: glycosyltransferase [Acidobacteriia bacterium]|nr:glycosyltransferase [Terriglobia bacterium]